MAAPLTAEAFATIAARKPGSRMEPSKGPTRLATPALVACLSRMFNTFSNSFLHANTQKALPPLYLFFFLLLKLISVSLKHLWQRMWIFMCSEQWEEKKKTTDTPPSAVKKSKQTFQVQMQKWNTHEWTSKPESCSASGKKIKINTWIRCIY